MATGRPLPIFHEHRAAGGKRSAASSAATASSSSSGLAGLSLRRLLRLRRLPLLAALLFVGGCLWLLAGMPAALAPVGREAEPEPPVAHEVHVPYPQPQQQPPPQVGQRRTPCPCVTRQPPAWTTLCDGQRLALRCYWRAAVLSCPFLGFFLLGLGSDSVEGAGEDQKKTT